MNMDVLTAQSSSGGKTRKNAVSVSETFWGYVIRPNQRAIDLAGYGELAAVCVGLFLGAIAYAQWLMPGTINSMDVLPFKLAATVVFFTFAYLLYLIARRGLCYEVQIDRQRKVIRTARRNRNGNSTQIETFAFHDIDSAFIRRSQTPVMPSRLFFCLSDDLRQIQVVTGDLTDLEPLLARIVKDLHQGNELRELSLAKPRSTIKAARAKSAFAAR